MSRTTSLDTILASLSNGSSLHQSVSEDRRLSESVNDHPNGVVALRRLRKLCNKIHGDVVPLPFRYLDVPTILDGLDVRNP
ncbi:hypothetical protein Tco_1122967 [Tanacetum coccineum]|uniref:Uncharacterized protein n=1 Tax=Tanacetum coccineum TaxID=301880 RepID=A0ABQ5J205_9ASTR